MSETAGPEFSRLLSREELARGPQTLSLAADEGERAALARRFGLLGLERLEAELSVAPQSDGLIRLQGRLSAAASQACVVTLEPVPALVEEDFSQYYSILTADIHTEHELVVDPEAEDPPEPLGPEGLDLGEAVAQQLATALPAYPRAAGAALDPDLAAPAAPGGPQGPFAELAALKRRH